jgi:hypothetical protein
MPSIEAISSEVASGSMSCRASRTIRDGEILSLPTLTEFETSQRAPNNLTPYADHFFRVTHFFERWALLYAENLLDHAMAARLLGSYVKSYRDRLLAPLEVGEANPDFIRLLKTINAMASSEEVQNQISEADPSEQSRT